MLSPEDYGRLTLRCCAGVMVCASPLGSCVCEILLGSVKSEDIPFHYVRLRFHCFPRKCCYRRFIFSLRRGF